MAVHDLYREFSDRLAGALERGDVPWTPAAGGRPVRYNARPYGGASVLAQWEASRTHGYTSPVWLTRGAVEALGGRLTAAAPEATLWYAGMRPVASPSRTTGELEIRSGAVWRPYSAWNVEAVDGLASRFAGIDDAAAEDAAVKRLAALAAAAGDDRPPQVPARTAARRDAAAGLGTSSSQEFRKAGQPDTLTRDEVAADDWYVAGGAVEVRDHGPHDAHPGPWRVYGTGEYAHEAQGDRLGLCRSLVAKTAHPARLNRRLDETRESLIVEIGAAFLAADLRLPAPGRAADADVDAWARLLQRDDLAIFRAARDATVAVEHIHAMAPGHRVEVAAPRIHPLLGERATTAARRPVSDAGLPADEGARMRAVDAARHFVAAAEAHRKDDSGGAEAERRGRALLEAADRIDLAVPGVADAVRAAAFLHGADVTVGADSYLAEFRSETKERLEAADVTESVEPQAFRGPGMRM